MTELDSELQRVLEEMADGVLAVDRAGHILFANQALEAMSGYSAGDMLRLGVEDLVPTAERESHERKRQGYHRSASPPRAMGAGLDIRLRRRDGSDLPVDIALSPVRTASGGTVVIAAIREKVEPRRGESLDPHLQRVERDLHERALQTLFGLSLNLQTMTGQVSDPALAQRLENAVQQVDDVVRDLRNYIFGLRPGILSTPRSVAEDPGLGGAV